MFQTKNMKNILGAVLSKISKLGIRFITVKKSLHSLRDKHSEMCAFRHSTGKTQSSVVQTCWGGNTYNMVSKLMDNSIQVGRKHKIHTTEHVVLNTTCSVQLRL